MKSITKYVATDGAEFTEAAACERYEGLIKEVDAIMSRLPKVEISGEGFHQHSGPVVLGVQHDLVALYERYTGTIDRHTQWARHATVPAGMTLIGRYIDDGGPSPIRAAWYRIMRMDHGFREYEQPYYAIQSDKRAA